MKASQERYSDDPRQLLSWSCADCGKLGSFFAPLPCSINQAEREMREDHRERAADCDGLPKLQSHVTNVWGATTMSDDEKDQGDGLRRAVPLRDILDLKSLSDAHGIPVDDPRAFPRGGPPPGPGLPPGPWRVEYGPHTGLALRLCDAEDRVILKGVRHQDFPDGTCLLATADVLRAVEALPLLVEAAQELVANVAAMGREGDYLTSAVRDAAKVLRDVLARADGEGRADT
jgi:hypothetical protein